MKFSCYTFVLTLTLLGLVPKAQGQARRPSPGRPAGEAPSDRPGAAPAKEDKPPVVITKLKLKVPVLVFYQPAAPGKAVQQLLMDEKYLSLLRTVPLEDLVLRREVFLDGLGNYDPPGATAEMRNMYRLSGVSLLARGEKPRPAPDGRSTYARLRVPSPGELYVVRESAEEYRHFVSGPRQQGSRIDFSVNGLPGVDSVRAVYTLRKMDVSERGAGSGEFIR